MKMNRGVVNWTLIVGMLFAGMFAPDVTASANAQGVKNAVVGVQGYDLVSYRNGKKPIQGNGNFVSVHKGVKYLFANKSNKMAFDKNPSKYVPAYGGYCAFGVSVKKKFIGDPTVWRVVDNKLYLNLDTGIQKMWLKDVPGRIATANKNWKMIKNKPAASL